MSTHLFSRVVFLISSCFPVFSDITFEEASGLYQNTKENCKHLSPFWGVVAAHSGMMESIRFNGPSMLYEFSKGRPVKKTSKEAGENTEASNQTLEEYEDKIAKLLVWLFPSPVSNQLTANTYDKDPAGNLSRNLEKISDVIDVLEKFSFSQDEKSNKVVEILDSLIKKNKNSQKVSNKEFADLLLEAYKEQESLANLQNPNEQIYPENIVVISLLTFYVKNADTSKGLSDLKFMNKEYVAQVFNEQTYKTYEDRNSLIQTVEETDDVELKFLLWKGYEAYRDKFIKPVSYRDSAYEGKTFPNCGETFIRNLFYVFLSTPTVGINSDRLDIFKRKIEISHHDDLLKHDSFNKLIAYFEKYPKISTSQKAHDDWNLVVSNLNNASTPLGLQDVYYQKSLNKKDRIFEIGASADDTIKGIFNVLNVFSKLIPDDILNAPWNIDQGSLEESYTQVESKLTRLFELLGTDDMHLTWRGSDGSDTIESSFPILNVYSNEQEILTLQFFEKHFDMMVSDFNENDWRNKVGNERFLFNDWDAGLYRKIPKDFEKTDLPISLIYSKKNSTVEKTLQVISFILTNEMINFYPLIPLWLKRDIPEDEAAMEKMAKVLYGYQDQLDLEKIIPSNYYEQVLNFFMQYEFIPIVMLDSMLDVPKSFERLLSVAIKQVEENQLEPLLSQAISNSLTVVAKELIRRDMGVNEPNKDNKMPLYQSLKMLNLEIVSELLEKKAIMKADECEQAYEVILNNWFIFDKVLIKNLLNSQNWSHDARKALEEKLQE